MVIDLKYFKSPGKCQGRVLFRPIVRLLAIATIRESLILSVITLPPVLVLQGKAHNFLA